MTEQRPSDTVDLAMAHLYMAAGGDGPHAKWLTEAIDRNANRGFPNLRAAILASGGDFATYIAASTMIVQAAKVPPDRSEYLGPIFHLWLDIGYQLGIRAANAAIEAERAKPSV